MVVAITALVLGPPATTYLAAHVLPSTESGGPGIQGGVAALLVVSGRNMAPAGLFAERSGAPVTAMDASPWPDLDPADRESNGIVVAPPARRRALLDLVR